jgi:Meckel syndrome type 1 protein
MQNGELMINRFRALVAATLGALVVGLASTAAIGGLAGVEVARAQSPAPAADTAVPPDSGTDGTAVGDLDPTDLVGPVDATSPATAPPADGTAAPAADTTPADSTPADTTPADTTPTDSTPADTTPADTTPADATPADATPADTAPADSAPDPEAGLDDTPTGTLDQSGLGGPVDDQGSTGTGTGPGTGSDSGAAPAPAPAPTPAPDPDAGLDDTPAGCLDSSGLGGPIDDTGAAGAASTDAASGAGTCSATGADPGTGSTTDPEAGLDDTPVGGLDSTNLGSPIDDTNQPPANTPPSTTPDPSPAPSGAAPAPAAGAPGTAVPPVYVVTNVPSSTPTGSGGQTAPKHKSSKKKQKSSKKKHKSSHKRHSSRTRKHGGRRRHTQKRETSGRVGLDLRPTLAQTRVVGARDRARRPSRIFASRGS